MCKEEEGEGEGGPEELIQFSHEPDERERKRRGTQHEYTTVLLRVHKNVIFLHAGSQKVCAHRR